MIGLIIAAHGSYALEVVRSAEMIYGEQNNVVAVEFVPGENQETLIDRYQAALGELNAPDGVLFLCDLFGGSPFNAASRVASEHDNMDVVSGLNLSMLLEVYGLRENGTLEDTVATALQAGRNGIQSLKSLRIAEEEEL